MSQSGQWHHYVPDTNIETNDGQAHPWEQPAWIYQRKTA